MLFFFKQKTAYEIPTSDWSSDVCSSDLIRRPPRSTHRQTLFPYTTRFRISPNSAIAISARVKRAGKEFVGDQRELYLAEEQPGAESPYERLLGDAMAGDGALFTREDAVEAAWGVVDSILTTHHPVHPYRRGTWGPKEADVLIEPDGSWHNPGPKEVPA